MNQVASLKNKLVEINIITELRIINVSLPINVLPLVRV